MKHIKSLRFILAPLLLGLGSQCADALTVTVNNNLDFPRQNEMVEISADSVAALLGSRYCRVAGPDGTEIPSQLTHDGLLVFPVTVDALSSASYTLQACDESPAYSSTVEGDLRPERADDISWENELVGFRVYGPATQRRGERAFGYDIFFKYPSEKPVLDTLYGEQCSSANWAKVDSLRKIDPKLAKEFENSFTYHLDHGLGMDCYAVGATLGDGVAALMDNDSLRFAWCYEKAEILDNGPIRFTVKVDFAPRVVGCDTLTEHRLITLDSGSHLNNTKVWFDGLSLPRSIAAGFPRRDDAAAVMNREEGFVAYSDPTQGDDNGRALLGAVLASPAEAVGESEGHILAKSRIVPGEPFVYSWGFAWSRTDIPTMEQWTQYLSRYAAAGRSPLTVVLQK